MANENSTEKRSILKEPYPRNLLLAVRGAWEQETPTELTADVLAGIQYAISTLNEREQLVIYRRYKERKKLREIGEEIGVQQERSRQIETAALRKLRSRRNMSFMTKGVDGYISKDFPHIKEEYEQALGILRRELGDEKIKAFLDAINRRCEADLLFCGSLGYQANLNNFRDPIARTFMDVDFEEYLRVEVLQRMPQRQEAEKEIDAFYHALNDEQKGVYDAISSYLVSLELDLTKLAHYAGFMFANDMLQYTEPGYVPNYVLTLRYQSFMSDWFGTEFKMWCEEKKEVEGLSA